MPDSATAGLIPAPYIALTIVDLDPACETITAYRTVGRRSAIIRGAKRITATGGVNVIDWQAPDGVDVSYRCEQFDFNGYSLGYTAPVTGRVDFNKTWIQNPLDPAGAVAVELGRGAAAELNRPQDRELARASGRALSTVVAGQRAGITESPLIFYTLTDEDTDRVNAILGDPYEDLTGPPVVCIRTPAVFNTGWPTPFVAEVELTPTSVNRHAGGHITRWAGTATEAEEPAIALVATVLTYDAIDAAYDSYDEMDAAYLSYLERDRDYRLAYRVRPTPTPTPNPTPGETDPPEFGAGTFGTGVFGA